MIGSTAARSDGGERVVVVSSTNYPDPSEPTLTLVAFQVHSYASRAFLKFTDAINVTAGSSGGRSLAYRPFVGLTVTNFGRRVIATVACVALQGDSSASAHGFPVSFRTKGDPCAEQVKPERMLLNASVTSATLMLRFLLEYVE